MVKVPNRRRRSDDICCQGHELEQHAGFICSLFVKRLLTKKLII